MMTKETFTALYKEHDPLVRAICRRRGLNNAEVEEVSQNVWSYLWAHSAHLQAAANQRAYVARSAVNGVSQLLRAGRSRGRGAHDPLPEDGSSTASLHVSSAPCAQEMLERTSLSSWLRRLAKKVGGDKQRALLHELDGTEHSLASQAAVRDRRHRALRAARKELGLSPEKPSRPGMFADHYEELAVRVQLLSEEASVA